MSSESYIKSAIEKIVGNYSAWTIGVTDDPARRRMQHDNPSVWYQWDADTETIARNVETYFIAKGMEGGTGGGGRADYVYIFI